MISISPLLKGKEDVMETNNGRMSNECVEVSGLTAIFQLEELLDCSEEDLYVQNLP